MENNQSNPAYGISQDFMIVHAETMAALPFAAQLMDNAGAAGAQTLERGLMTWKSRPQPHMIRMATTQPEQNLNGLDFGIADEVRAANRILAPLGACLMSGGTHPLATAEELRYDRPTAGQRMFSSYFSCSGHGWVNTCSALLDIPLTDDESFARLSAAVRIVLPLIPALTASSPILEGKRTIWRSNRLELDRLRFTGRPQLYGKLIPEAVFTEQRYRETVFAEILSAFRKPGDTDEQIKLLPERLNRRGAVPLFSEKAMQIRLADPQECAAADIAVFKLIIEVLRAMEHERFCSYEEQMRAQIGDLTGILRDGAEAGMQAEVISSQYLSFFGMDGPATIGAVWKHLFDTLSNDPVKPLSMYEHELSIILEQGSLADRILTVLGENPHRSETAALWRRLCDCLEQNRLLIL